VRTPSPALIVAGIALFVALGGTSYAVTQLPKNSVGTKQLKANSVTGAKVKNGSLAAVDFSNAALNALQGATGPAGPAGATGATGPSNVIFGRQAATVTVNNTTGVTVGSMDVPAGAYSVVAAMTLTNVSGSDVAAASCGLTYGDRTSYQAADLGPTGATPRIATQELTLLVANTTTATGPISVVCTRSAAPGSAGNFDVTNLRIVATQTGALTTVSTN
jgi:hypothetical protein